MMTKWGVLAVALVAAGCAQLTSEQEILNDAAAALGGRDRVQAVRWLVMEGDGTQYNLGQDMQPGASGQTFTVSAFKRTVDVGGKRARTELTRTPNFAYFQGQSSQRQLQGVDGDVGYNVGATGNPTPASSVVTEERRAELYHHPITIVAAALAEGATLSNARTAGGERQVDIALPDGLRLVLVTDDAGLPLRVESRSTHPNLGDVTLTTAFADYTNVDGLSLPSRLTTQVDDFTTGEIRIATQSTQVDPGDLAAPAAVLSAPPPAAPTINVTAEAIAPGLWLLAGQSHHSALVEFSDHLTLIDAPQSEARTLAVIAKARELRPDKPLTMLVTTHHHFDHTAGVRAAVAEGLQIVTHSGNVAFFEEVAKRPHTISPDALAKNPRTATVVPIDDERVFSDETMEMVLYHVAGNPHSDTMLMAYFPRQRVLVEVDAFSPAAATHPYAANLLENITKRKLAVDRIVPLHGAVTPFAELVKASTPQ
jgi:glyoxylase-like metal-dependent hydrolase (beta-lactamase superfamily II)